MLLADVVLKPVPVRVTVAPTLALVGVKEVMVGGDTVPVLELVLATAKTGLPSPFKYAPKVAYSPEIDIE
jgi:xanthosine utilization system XapX-like protein